MVDMMIIDAVGVGAGVVGTVGGVRKISKYTDLALRHLFDEAFDPTVRKIYAAFGVCALSIVTATAAGIDFDRRVTPHAPQPPTVQKAAAAVHPG